MPYSSVKELPQAVKTKLKSAKKRRQWMHVWNSEYDRNHDESRAFASAWSAVRKFHVGITQMDDQLNFFLPIAKIDKEKRTVSGYASTDCLDSDGEIVAQDAIKAALPDYMKYGNIREMHKTWAVGVTEEANLDTRGLFITAKIVDDNAWQKCVEGVYKGFSIGGRKLAKVGNMITKIGMSEISVVDRPANPDCQFAVAKMAGGAGGEQKPAAYLLSGDELAKSIETNETDEKTEKAAKDAKKARKLAKLAAKKSASQSPSVTHDADGGAEAALGKVQSRHELDLGKTLKAGLSPNSLAELSLSKGDTGISLTLDSLDSPKLRKAKGTKMADDNTQDNSALTKALIQLLSQQGAAKPNPTLGLLKAAESDMKLMKAHRREAEDCVKALFDMHKKELAKTYDGVFDHAGAAKLLQKMFGEISAIKTIAKSARDNLAKAAGRVSAPGTVEDGTSYYTPDPGGNLTLVSPGEMDNLPAHKGDKGAVDLKKYVPADQVEALTKLAKLEAENALLKSMPAAPSGGRRPQGFDLSKFGGSEADSNVLLKGINPADLSSHDESTRESAVAKMIGNSLLSGRTSKPLMDPNFHGTAGLGKPN